MGQVVEHLQVLKFKPQVLTKEKKAMLYLAPTMYKALC
jgi:hypothetical protein